MKHALLILISLATSAFAYERLQGPTELLFYDKEKALNGYTPCAKSNCYPRRGFVVPKWVLPSGACFVG
jgi:hypothetical protein